MCSSKQETRSIGVSRPVSFLRHGQRMIGGDAVAGFAVGGTDAVPVLRDLKRSPVQIRKRSDDASDHTGLATLRVCPPMTTMGIMSYVETRLAASLYSPGTQEAWSKAY